MIRRAVDSCPQNAEEKWIIRAGAPTTAHSARSGAVSRNNGKMRRQRGRQSRDQRGGNGGRKPTAPAITRLAAQRRLWPWSFGVSTWRSSLQFRVRSGNTALHGSPVCHPSRAASRNPSKSAGSCTIVARFAEFSRPRCQLSRWIRDAGPQRLAHVEASCWKNWRICSKSSACCCFNAAGRQKNASVTTAKNSAAFVAPYGSMTVG